MRGVQEKKATEAILMKNPIPYITCVVCKRDPEPNNKNGNSYGRYGNRSMVCKHCRRRNATIIKNMDGDEEAGEQ